MIKGLSRKNNDGEFDAREAAKLAARRAGLSLTDWINQVVQEKAEDLGLDEDDLDEDDRLNAVIERLNHLNARRGRAQSPRDRAFNEYAAPRRDPDELISEVLQKVERRSKASEQLSNGVLGRVMERLETMEQRLARKPGNDNQAVLQQALERIEHRMDAFDAKIRPPKPASAAPASAALASAAPAHQTEPRAPQNAGTQNARAVADEREDIFSAIESKLNALNASLERQSTPSIDEPAFKHLTARQRPNYAAETVFERPVTPVPSQFASEYAVSPRGMQELVRQDFTRQQEDFTRQQEDFTRQSNALHQGGSTGQQQAAAAASAQAFDSLHAEIAKLAAQMEDMRRPQAYPEIDALRHDLAQMAEVVAELAPRRSVHDLEQRISALVEQVLRTNDNALSRSMVEPVSNLASDLRQAMSELDPHKGLGALESEIRYLAQKVSQMETGGFDYEAFTNLQNQTQDIRDLLQQVLARPRAFDALETQIDYLTSRVESLSASPSASKSADVVAAIDEIRALVDHKLATNNVEMLERRVENLAAKIDTVINRAPEPHGASPYDRAPVMDTGTLENMLRALAARMDEARQPQADTRAFAALQEQIAQISSQMERSEAGLAGLSSLQRSINNLFSELEDTRHVAVKAAEQAARQVARESAHELMGNVAGAPVDLSQLDLSQLAIPQVDRLARSMGELLQAQDVTQQRAEATLSAVHSTLEKIVGRLASLEEEIAEARQPMAPPVPTFSPQQHAAPQNTVVTQHAAPVPVAANFAYQAPTPGFEAPRPSWNDEQQDERWSAPQPTAPEPPKLTGRSAEPLRAIRPTVDVYDETTGEPVVAAPVIRMQERVADFAPNLDPAADSPAAEDFLLEPRSGASPRRGVAPAVETQKSARAAAAAASMAEDGPVTKSEFIAAARRAAQAAAVASHERITDAPSPRNDVKATMVTEDETSKSVLERARAFIENRKRPLLLGLAGVMILVLGAQLVRVVATRPADLSKTITLSEKPVTLAPPAENSAKAIAAVPVSAVPMAPAPAEVTPANNAPLSPTVPKAAGSPAPAAQASAPQAANPALAALPVPAKPVPAKPVPAKPVPANNQTLLAPKPLRAGSAPLPKYGFGNALNPDQERPGMGSPLAQPSSGFAKGVMIAPPTSSFTSSPIMQANRRIDMTPLGTTTSQPDASAPFMDAPVPSPSFTPPPKQPGVPTVRQILPGPMPPVAQPEAAPQAAQPVASPSSAMSPVSAPNPAPEVVSAPVPSPSPAAVSSPAATPIAPQPVKMIAPQINSNPMMSAPLPPSIDPAFQPASPALKAAAQAGNAAAQYELGAKYADGRGETRDFKAAADLFEKASVQGLAPAQYRLGALYEKGLGVARDLIQARSFYQRAAEAGNPRAMYNLAVLFADGVDGNHDYANAVTWFRKAAEYGVRDSQYNLAILYARGMGATQDLSQSYMWFALAAMQGDEDAAKKRDDVASRLDALALEKVKAAVATFQAKTADPTVINVTAPAGGWETVAPKAENKLYKRVFAPAKISQL